VTQLDITNIGWVNPCHITVCPLVQAQVQLKTSNQDPVKLTLVLQGADGPRTYTRNLSGSTSYDLLFPEGNETPYPSNLACPNPPVRGAAVTATATTIPAAPKPSTVSLPCS
jgi:hypothetical protein